MGVAFLEEIVSNDSNIVNDQRSTYSASACGLGCRFSGSKICTVDFAASVGVAFLFDQSQHPLVYRKGEATPTVAALEVFDAVCEAA